MEFRQSRWLVAAVGLGAAFSAVGFVALVKMEGLSWQVWLLGGVAVVFALGLADATSSFVRLDHDALRIRSNFRCHTFGRNELVEVSWAKGCPVSVKVVSGTWVTLPPLGDSSAMANSIRAWLRRG